MSGPWEKKMKHRDWSRELLEIVHAEGYEASTFRELRHLLNVPKDEVPALQDALATLLEQGRVRLGSRDRIHASKERPTRAERNAERDRERDLEKVPRRAPKDRQSRGLSEPQAPGKWTGPSWKQVQKLFADSHELPGPFSQAVKDQAARYGEPSEDDFKGREDCRGDEVCTIDPWNAHDHDDAVAVENLPQGGWRMDVHIADVSHYVTEGSPLDKQAVKRSFTTYLPWTAVTMLPQGLAADLCSLLDNKDRLALSCRMEISTDGQILNWRFFEAVVRVRRFLSYEQAQELADKGDAALQRLKACSEALLARRRQENLLEFDMPEPRVVFDDKGEPVDARPGERLPSHRWIEEAMLAANRCCAKLLDEKGLPGLYRVHEPPEQEALFAISSWATALDLPRWMPSRRADGIEESNVRPQAQEWLGRILASGAIPPGLQGKVVRSMKKARYSPDCRGHFALGWLHYAHYTSPIRRYPDLWTHRVIKEHLHSGQVPGRWPATVRRLATHVSGREDAVVKAERSGNKCCAAWILRERLGEEFSAEITGVEPIGMFVLLSEPWAEGMVHVRRMSDDFYQHDEERMELKGRSRGKVFRIGDRIRVRLAQADPVQGWVDFEPVVEGEQGMPPAPARQAASGRAPSRPPRGRDEGDPRQDKARKHRRR
jgi:ribonuclease R